MAPLQDRPRAQSHRRARLRSNDAVGDEPVPALPALHGALGRRAEDAVGAHAHLALELADVGALARGMRLHLGPRSPGAIMVMPPASASATTTETAFLCTSTAPSVGFRLRGELTGSRACATPRQRPGRFAPAARRPHRFPRSPHPEVRRFGVRTGGFLSTTVPFFLQAARFVAK